MKKLILTLTTLVLTLGVAAVAEPSIFEGGNGTAENPYQIATVEQLMAFAASVNDGSTDGYAGQSIVLTADIDAAEMDWQPIGRMDLENMENGAEGFLPDSGVRRRMHGHRKPCGRDGICRILPVPEWEIQDEKRE